MMESVEDIPADSIMSGLAWDWTTYGEYLDAVERWPKGINVGGMVGHCAVRVHAMGERSLSEEPATDDDIAAMCALVDEAIGAGALGFSTSRTLLHRVPDGRPVPGTWATADELMAIAEVMGRHHRGVFEAAPRLGERDSADYEASPGRGRDDGRHHHRLGPAADVRPGPQLPPRRPLRPGARVRERGQRPRRQRPPADHGPGHRHPLRAVAPHALRRRPGTWKRLRMLSLNEKLAVLRDPASRMQLIEEGADRPGRRVPQRRLRARRRHARLRPRPREHARPRWPPGAGVTPVEAFIDLSLETNGRVLLNYPFLNQRLDAVAEMLADPNVVMGLADAGAHVGQIMDASQPTFFLTNWVRERGVFPIEEGVRRLTSDTANLFGITDRGVLRAGLVRRRQRDRPRRPGASSCPSTSTTSPAAPAATCSGPRATGPPSSTAASPSRTAATPATSPAPPSAAASSLDDSLELAAGLDDSRDRRPALDADRKFDPIASDGGQ